MLKQSLIKLFERDLEKLKEEILLFENESDLWITAGDVNNSPGNLCLHICGNLKHFVGNVLGGTDFIRERAKELIKILHSGLVKMETTSTNNDKLKLMQDTLKELDFVVLENKGNTIRILLSPEGSIIDCNQDEDYEYNLSDFKICRSVSVNSIESYKGHSGKYNITLCNVDFGLTYSDLTVDTMMLEKIRTFINGEEEDNY